MRSPSSSGAMDVGLAMARRRRVTSRRVGERGRGAAGPNGQSDREGNSSVSPAPGARARSPRPGLGGCAGSMKGDFVPKTGRRVVVIGGGWGGATAAKYVRLERPVHRGRAARAEPGVRLVSVQQPRAERRAHARQHHVRLHGLAQARRASSIHEIGRRHRAGPPSACGSARATWSTTGWSSRPGVEFQWEQIEGLAENQDRVLHAWKAGPQTAALAEADPVDGRRRRLRPDRAARGLSLSARPVRAASARSPGTSRRTSRAPR